MSNILITGITGQDGSNMIRFLLKKFNNDVNIIGCYNNENKLKNISDIIDRITICKLDFNQLDEIDKIIYKYLPDYIFNFSSAQPQFENNNIDFLVSTIAKVPFCLPALRGLRLPWMTDKSLRGELSVLVKLQCTKHEDCLNSLAMSRHFCR